MSALSGQLPVSQFSAVKEKHKMASHLACLSSGAVNIVTIHGTVWAGKDSEDRFVSMPGDLGGSWLFEGFGGRQCAEWSGCARSCWVAPASSGGGCGSPSLLRASRPTASSAPRHLHLSPVNSEPGRCFENRMLGLRIIKEKTERETV